MASQALSQTLRSTFELPLFLTPAFTCSRPSSIAHTRTFTSSSALCGRRQNHRKRGVSGHRKPIVKYPRPITRAFLPTPVESPQRRSSFKTSDTHGLWAFFHEDKQPLISPEEEASHGRAWTYKELSVKDWDDLYKLYWTCILEANRLATRKHELVRLHAGFGLNELSTRQEIVQNTLRNIRTVLYYRQINYTEARNMLEVHDDAQTLLEEDAELMNVDQNIGFDQRQTDNARSFTEPASIQSPTP